MFKGRTILFLFFLIALNNALSQQYWLQQPCPTTKKLTRIVFADTLYGWIAGDSGAVLHTINGGQNWTVQQSETFASISDVFFLNRQKGWLIANDFGPEGSLFLKTTNGGNNWIQDVNPDTTLYFSTIYYLDSFTGFIGGYGGVIMKTTDSGAKWSRCAVD